MMLRLLGIVIFLTAAAGVCGADRAPTEVVVQLELPGSATPPINAPERISRLVIDGQDFSTPRSTLRSITVRPKAGADSVKVEYTYWPNRYTRIIRTRMVKVEKGKLAKASLRKADPAAPDKIWVIFVPTPMSVVDAMCKLAKIGKKDVVYDVGCGDGRLVIHAVNQFAAKKGVGIELQPELIKECKANARTAEVEDRVSFLQKDALTIKDFSEASVVLLYLSDPLNAALRPTLRKTLKPGTRIVSHRFLMGDWKPDNTETIWAKDNRGRRREFKIHLWTIKP